MSLALLGRGMWPRCLCAASRYIKTIESVGLEGLLFTEEHDRRNGDASRARRAPFSRNEVALKSLLSGLPYIPGTAHLDNHTAHRVAS